MAEGQVNQFLRIVFSDMPAMRPVGQKRQYEMLEPLSASWTRHIERQELTVPIGFIHNGPSIPDRLRGIVFYTHRLLRPSIVHDYLYWHGAKLGWTRKEADRLFLEALKVEGVGLIRRHAMWFAVRAAGRSHWSKS